MIKNITTGITLFLISGISLVIYLWNVYLDYRQYVKLRESKVPVVLKGVVKQGVFDKSRDYSKDKSRVKFVQDLYFFILSTILILENGYAFFWNMSKNLLESLKFKGTEVEISCVFLLIYTLFSIITKLPFSLYSTFVVEEKHGFNKQTLGLFFSDMIKSILLGMLMGAPLVSGVIMIVRKTGRDFYFYLWVFMLLFQIVLIMIYPTLIQPLFNTFTPLEDGELKKGINELAEKINFPLTKIFVVDGSKRSGHSNAYFFGFFKNKRIVLFDTLLETSTNEETFAVLAHELGHWKLNHILKNLIFSNIHSFIMYYLVGFALWYDPLFQTFGFQDKPVVIGFLLFSYLYAPVEELLSFLFAILSRTFEYQADAFAKSLGYEQQLKSGLIKLNIENLGNMNPDPWFSAWHHSHPTLVERLNALGVSEKKTD
jgi:STE24 endopeptidase